MEFVDGGYIDFSTSPQGFDPEMWQKAQKN